MLILLRVRQSTFYAFGFVHDRLSSLSAAGIILPAFSSAELSYTAGQLNTIYTLTAYTADI